VLRQKLGHDEHDQPAGLQDGDQQRDNLVRVHVLTA